MKQNNNFMISLVLILGIGLFTSCSDDSGGKKQVDKTALTASITAAQALLAGTEEGTSDGQYLMGSKADLETAIAAAQAVATSADSDDADVANAIVNLEAAVTEYESNLITPIAPANLMAHWKFDEGAGTSAEDASANGLDGVFTTGHSYWGSGDPEWSADRYGNANSAIYFDMGANVEVPYNTKLNATEMTISIWMKQDVNDPILNNQYMVSMNRWNGFKLNMQSDPKAFMTVKADVSGSPDPAYYDRDNADPILTQGDWYHVVVTFGGGHMIFYVNGVMVKDWDNTPGTGISLSGDPVNLTIGQDLPTSVYSTDDTSPYYVNWGGYFKGSLDEIRIYNTVLTGTQAQTLYNIEKP